MGLSIARGLPGIRQVVGREVSLRQSSGGARLRSWGVGFHPAPVYGFTGPVTFAPPVLRMKVNNIITNEGNIIIPIYLE